MIPEHVKERILFIIKVVDGNSNDWFQIKQMIINSIHSKYRSLFSRRHFSTKKHFINDFDKEIIKFWENETNTKLFINPEKLHNKNWVHKKRGWKLEIINKQRKLEKLQKNN